MKKTLFSKITLVLLVILLITSGCASKDTVQKEKEQKIAIAEQYGLAYAPIQVMKELKLMDKNLPGVQVEWKQLGNTAAIREAMLVNEVDAGFMAIPPFLIGWDKGMKWKIASGLSESPIGLVTYRDDIKSIKDLTNEDRIALPQPGSIQHILLSMASEREFGEASKFDNQLVTLAHPDGMNALLAKKDITAHFTSPPYIFKELETEGMHQILDGEGAMGKPFTFIVGVTTNKFHDENPEVYKAFVKSLHESIDYINEHPEETASMLKDVYKIPEEELLKYLTWEGNVYSKSIKGIDEFVNFTNKNGYISKTPESIDEILWEDAEYEK